MRRSTAVVTSVGWFALTAGIGAVLVPWWLTSWRLPHPLPYGGVPGTLGMVLIVAGLIPAVHVFVQFVRAGGTPMPGAMTRRLVVTGFNRYVRNPIYLRWRSSLASAAVVAVERVGVCGRGVGRRGGLRALVRSTGVGAPVRVGLRGIPARGSRLVAAAASLVARRV